MDDKSLSGPEVLLMPYPLVAPYCWSPRFQSICCFSKAYNVSGIQWPIPIRNLQYPVHKSSCSALAFARHSQLRCSWLASFRLFVMFWERMFSFFFHAWCLLSWNRGIARARDCFSDLFLWGSKFMFGKALVLFWVLETPPTKAIMLFRGENAKMSDHCQSFELQSKPTKISAYEFH